MFNFWAITFYLLKKILVLIIFILTVIVSPFFLIVFYIWKTLATFCALIFYPDLSPMKYLDYMTVTTMDTDIDDPNSKNFNPNIVLNLKLNGKVDGQSFFQLFEKNVIQIDYSKEIPSNHKHIRFHQSISRFGGYWFFKTFPNKLKYEDHVTCTTLNDNISYEEEICEWLKNRYDIKKCPLWGILLLYRKESDDIIFSFKIHHLLADGYSVLHILDLLTNTQRKYPVKEFQDKKWKTFKIWTKAAFGYFGYLLETIMSVAESPLYKGENEDGLFITQVTVPLPLVKDIRHKTKVRFQAVMLDLVLNYINCLINETAADKKEIPDKICTFASLPWPNHPQDELCNHFTNAPLAFKIKNQNNPKKESIQEVNKIFQDFEDKHYDRAVYHFVKPIALLPKKLIYFIQRKLCGKICLTYAHLICSEKYSEVFGIECNDVSGFLVPYQQKAVSVLGFSISNEIKLTIVGPKSLFTSQEHADKFLQDNLQNYIAKQFCVLSERKFNCLG